MSLDAGSVFATLGGKFNPAAFNAFDGAVKKSVKSMSTAEIASKRAHETMNTFGNVAKGVATGGLLAFGAVVAKSISLAADFEQQLSSLQSVSGATAAQMTKLKQAAMDAGAATKFSALDAAKAQTELAKGGLSVTKILGGGLKGALSLAAAGELDLAEAASTTANALNLFGLSGGQAGHVADALATAANSTTADVHDFALALQQGGGAAKAAGLSFDETVVALEALAQNGIKGSDAGTSLKTALVQIASPSKQSAEAMKKLGLAFFDATGSIKPLPVIADMLKQKLGGLTDQQRLSALQTIAGTDGFRSLLALYDEGGKSLGVYGDQLKKQGSAAEVAATKQDNFRGKLENFKGSLETAGIALGTKLLPQLSKLAVQGTAAVNNFSGAQIADFASTISAGFTTSIDVLYRFGRATKEATGYGRDVVKFLSDLGNAVGVSDSTQILAIAAGFGAFKVVGVVAPLMFTFGRSLIMAATAVRLYGLSAGLAATAAGGPFTVLAAGAAILAAGLVILSSRESDEEQAAKASAEAKRDQAKAFAELKDAERASVDSKFAAQRSTLDLAKAEEHLHDVRKDPKASTQDLKDAELGLAEARARSVSSHEDYAKSLQKENAAKQEGLKTTGKRIDQARDEKKAADDAYNSLAAKKAILGPGYGPSDDALAAATERRAKATKDLAKAEADQRARLSQVELGPVNKARREAGQFEVTTDNADGFRTAMLLIEKLPKKVQTRIELDSQDAVAEAGKLSTQLLDIKGMSIKVVARILANAENAKAGVQAFKAILAGVKPSTVAKIEANTRSATVEVQAFKAAAAGVPTKKTLSILSSADSEKAKVIALQNAINALHDKTINITTIQSVGRKGAAAVLNATRPKRAAGRASGAAERALVGEGRGPELVGNQDSGWSWVTRPTVMDLAPGDAVIPTDPQYAGRALGLMFSMLGIEGYAKGKAAKKKPAAKAKVLPVPDAVTFGAVPEDELNASKDAAREAYQKRKGRVHDLDVDIRADKKKVKDAKGAKAKQAAHDKLVKDQRDRHRYNDGGEGLSSLSDMKKQWQALQQQATVLHRTNLEIDRLNTRQQTDQTKMATASKKGDEGAWSTARTDRNSILKTLQAKYAKAVDLAKPGSNFQADLEAKLAGIEGDIADAAGDEFATDLSPAQQAAQDAADRLAETGMTDAERQALAGLQAQQSLAGLTADLGDDQAAAAGIEQFLTGILGEVQADPARGGSSTVRDIADQLKQARSDVASFSGGGAVNQNADVQAQLDQQTARADAAERNAQVNAQALSVFQGAGDIGMRPSVVLNQHFGMLVPPTDPAQLAVVGNAAVAGMGQQAFVTSPRTDLGL